MLSYTSLTYIDSTHINGLLHNVALNEGKDEYFFQLTFTDDYSRIDELLSYAQKNHISLAFSNTLYKGSLIYNDYYLLSYDKNDLNNIIFDKQEEIDFSKYEKPFYYTTDVTDQMALGYMMTLNPHYYEGEQFVKSLHNMNGIKDVIQKEGIIDLHFYTSSSYVVDEIKALLENNQVQYVDMTQGYSPVQIHMIFNEEVSKIALLFVVSTVMIVLLMVVDVIKQKRRIMIKRLNGVSVFKILMKEYGLFFVEEIFVFSVFLLGFMYMKSGSLSFYNLHYYAYAKVFIGVFILLMSLFMFIVYIYMNHSTQLKYLKMNKRIQHFSLLNMVIKAVVLSLLLSPLTSLLNQFNENVTQYVAFNKNADFLSDLGKVVIQEDSIDKRIEVFNYLIQQDGIYCDFSTYQYNTFSFLKEQFQDDDSIDDEDIKEMSVDFPYIYANASYLKNHNIKDEKGNSLDLTSFKEDVVLVPKEYKNEQIKKMMWGKEIKTISIQNTDTYLNYKIMEPYYLNNPVICLVTHHSDLINDSTNLYVDLRTKSINDYEKEIKDNLDATINIDSNEFLHLNIIKNLKTQIEEVMLTLIVYLLFILIFIYQTAYMYLNENNKKIAIKYMNGFFLWKDIRICLFILY